MNILVTGTAGFIGFHLAKALSERGDEVTGLDNINEYYDVELKYARLRETGIKTEKIKYNEIQKSTRYQQYSFIKLDLNDRDGLFKLFEKKRFDAVCHLAAQAGVRYSLKNPYVYLNSNINGFLNILEACRIYNVNNLCFASSSSVYGLNQSLPLNTDDNVDHPVSLYAATKKANELMAHSYSYLYNIKTTGIRFFTVYGPWGRPDMALFIFVSNILRGKPIEVYNYGKMRRDFTFIDDIVEGIILVMDNPAKPIKALDGENLSPSSSTAPYRIYNLGSSSPIELIDFIKEIENKLRRKAIKNMLPLQPGDVKATYADTQSISNDLGYHSKTSIKDGISSFISWYKNYYLSE